MKTDTGKRKQNSASQWGEPDPIEELLASAYPNPDRVGCPGSSVIEALGDQKISKSDPVWNHIWHCSPCFQEFKFVRDSRWQKERAEALQRKRIRLAAAVVAAVLVIVAMLWVLRRKSFSKEQQEVANQSQHSDSATTLAQVDFVTFNLLDAGTYRGGESHDVDLPPVHRRIVEMRIILPRFSGTGHYAILVLKPNSSDSVVAEGSGNATGNDTVAEVKVRLNLASAAPGIYRLATRREGDQAMYYYPLRIVD